MQGRSPSAFPENPADSKRVVLKRKPNHRDTPSSALIDISILHMARLTLLATLALAFFGVAFAAPSKRDTRTFTLCGEYPDGPTIDYVSVYPEPPVGGAAMNVIVNARTKEEIGADVTFTVGIEKDGEVTAAGEPVNMCEATRKLWPQAPCPILAGQFAFAYAVDLPEEISDIKINTAADSLFCFDFSPLKPSE